jgi:hypothetical protein
MNTEQETNLKKAVPAVMLGRCATGYEGGKGAVIHSVEITDRELEMGISDYRLSLCGKTHGARSAGWSMRSGQAITCLQCLKKEGKSKC